MSIEPKIAIRSAIKTPLLISGNMERLTNEQARCKARAKRLRQMGDRVQSSLPGGNERWGMLAPLRVTLPTTPQTTMVRLAV